MDLDIIRLDKSYILKAGEVLGRALKDDPVSMHVIPDTTNRHLKIKHIFQTTVCLGVRYGEAYATSPNLEGIAVWLPFKEYKENKIRMLICGFKARIYKMGSEAGKRFRPVEEVNARMHKEFAPGEHWYLQSLGVDPENQGKGYGTALMNYMLPRIDQQGLPVFLETSTEVNVKFYNKLGFNVVKEMKIPETSVKEFFMLRESKK